MWSSLTCLFAYSFERDVTEKWVNRYPVLYEAGQKRVYFSYKVFWKWVILSFYHGLIVYICSTVGFLGAVDGSGRSEDMWFSSTIAFSVIIHIVTIKIFIEIVFFNLIVFAAASISLLVYWIMVICMNTSMLAPYFNS